MSETRRRLPHIYPEGKWLFVTWHLNGSLPQGRYPPPGLRAGGAFVWMDRYLDTTRVGPMYLRRDDTQLEEMVAYIETNPVKAGFVTRPEDYPWSSAAKPAARDGKSAVAAGTSACATSTAAELLHRPHA